jgi:VWFA-related protein
MRAKVWLLTFVLAVNLLPDPATPDPSVIKVSSRLVEISVVVRDKTGAFVRDLKREDFVVRDNGTERSLAFFSPQMAAPVKAARTLVTADAKALSIRNRSSESSGPATVTLVLLDTLNSSSIAGTQQGKIALVKFLANFQANEPLGLYSLEGENLRVISDFTQDPSSLLEVAKHYTISRFGSFQAKPLPADMVQFSAQFEQVGAMLASQPPLPMRGGDLSAEHLRFESAKIIDLQTVREDPFLLGQRVTWTSQALQTLANHLSSIPGRKNLIWISGAFPEILGIKGGAALWSEVDSYAEEVQRITHALGNANISIYPIDSTGLITDPRFDADRGGQQALAELRQPQGYELAMRDASISTMEVMAHETGGRAYFNNNDVEGSIRKAMDDSTVSYLLGYYPAESDWDGKFHKLDVKIDRPGMDVRARKSYFAARADVPVDDKKWVEAAITSPLDSLGIGLSLTASSNPMNVGPQAIDLTVDARDLNLINKDGLWQDDFELIFTQFSADGHSLKVDLDSGTLKFSTERYNEVRAKGWSYHRNIDLQPGAASLRIVMHDKSTGAIGSITAPARAGKT